jgi:ammonia channel protein AmtB
MIVWDKSIKSSFTGLKYFCWWKLGEKKKYLKQHTSRIMLFFILLKMFSKLKVKYLLWVSVGYSREYQTTYQKIVGNSSEVCLPSKQKVLYNGYKAREIETPCFSMSTRGSSWLFARIPNYLLQGSCMVIRILYRFLWKTEHIFLKQMLQWNNKIYVFVIW